MNVARQLAALAPGPILGFATGWTDLFAATMLADPLWAKDVSDAGAIVGTVACLVAFAYWRNASKDKIGIIGWRWAKAFGFAAVACWIMRLVAGAPWEGANAYVVRSIWESAFIALMVTMIVSVALGSLYAAEKESSLRPVLLAVVGVLVLALGGAAIAYLFR